MNRFELEVCVDRIDVALLAEQAGATRIELNSALGLDGLTPSIASCESLAQECKLPILAMLRPHAESFIYSPRERICLQRDAELLLSTGIQGLVFGALTDAGVIDLELTRAIASIASQGEFVFHRAFDAIENQVEALEQLIDLGVTRVLTSGGAPTAYEGLQKLRHLQTVANGRIEILPGAGVNSSNAKVILAESGCGQLHGSFREASQSPTPGHLSTQEISAVRRILEASAAD